MRSYITLQALGDDKAELVAIFEACYEATQEADYTGPEMLHVGGFTPWSVHMTTLGACLNLSEIARDESQVVQIHVERPWRHECEQAQGRGDRVGDHGGDRRL